MGNQYNTALYYPQNLDLHGGQYQPALYPSVFPAFHVLSKANGETLDVRWQIRNDGALDGFAHLNLSVGSQTTSNPFIFTVFAGTTRLLPRGLVLVGQPVGAAVAGVVTMVEVTDLGVFIRNLASHNFTVNIPAAGPILVELGDPSIS